MAYLKQVSGSENRLVNLPWPNQAFALILNHANTFIAYRLAIRVFLIGYQFRFS